MFPQLGATVEKLGRAAAELQMKKPTCIGKVLALSCYGHFNFFFTFNCSQCF